MTKTNRLEVMQADIDWLDKFGKSPLCTIEENHRVQRVVTLARSLLNTRIETNTRIGDVAGMEPLGREFEKIWDDNLDKLLETDAPAPQSITPPEGGELVEQVARAICRVNTEQRCRVAGMSFEEAGQAVDCQVENGWDLWKPEAEAAIAALSTRGASDEVALSDVSQALQDHMEQFHGVTLLASEWDAAVRAALSTLEASDGQPPKEWIDAAKEACERVYQKLEAANQASDTKGLVKLAAEYRPTMDKDVLHSWAADVVEALDQHRGSTL